MRGAQGAMGNMEAAVGIIPAYAGSTVCSSLFSTRSPDHPRVCGEHLTSQYAMLFDLGSSPRMRGAPDLLAVDCRVDGIIPAYAGSTPHALSKVPAMPGSSPRMRGALKRLGRDYNRRGIIPAYAGSTMTSKSAATATWDHPRVCGEHSG